MKIFITGDNLPASHDNSPTPADTNQQEDSFKESVAKLFSKKPEDKQVEATTTDSLPPVADSTTPVPAYPASDETPTVALADSFVVESSRVEEEFIAWAKDKKQDPADDLVGSAGAEAADAVDSSEQEPVAQETANEPEPATEAILLAHGYEYVTEDTAPNHLVEDGEDDSLTFSLMKNGEVVEKPTREERKADKAEAKAAAAAAKVAEQERAERLRAAQAAIAAAAAAKAAQEAAERDRLAPVLPTQSASSEDDSTGFGSRPLFITSALLTAAAAVAAAVLVLPNMGANRSEVSSTTAEVGSSPTASASATESPSAASSSAAPAPAPVPSFNTKVPTVTEQTPAVVEAPVAPGTVQYVPPVETQAPVLVPVAPETVAPVELAPQPTLEPTLEVTAEAPEPTAPATPEPLPTEPLATQPVTDPATALPTQPVEPSTPAQSAPETQPVVPSPTGAAEAPTAVAPTAVAPSVPGTEGTGEANDSGQEENQASQPGQEDGVQG